MSQKHKKRPARPGSNARRQLDTPQLEQAARAELAAGRWRDAITAYKELLKRESRPDWCQELGTAYAGRAQELTRKGMPKEALTIWENRAALDASLPLHPAHSALLAAQVLSGQHQLLERLTAEDPVRAHAPAALEALQAYCAGDDARLSNALEAIPFRSPYRDWVRLLKALVQLEQAPGDARAQLERIPETSPFVPLKRAIQLGLETESAFLPAANVANAERSAQFQLAGTLRGWSTERLRLWREFARLGHQPAPKVLISLLYRHRESLGEHWVRRKALSLAMQGGRQGIKWLRAAGAPSLNTWEKALLMAWIAEQDHDPWEMAEAWQHCADLLRAPEQADLAQRYQRMALILRRTATVTKVLTHPASSSEDLDELQRQLVEQLECSLDWDPLERPTYLQLIQFYRQTRELKEARRILAAAEQHWPGEISLLEAAMDIALDAGSFKKAAGLARQILDLDPINSGVRERLISAHVSHARKQVKSARLDLAHKELAEANAWAKTPEAQAQLALAEQLLHLLANQEEAISALRARFNNTASGLDARMELVLAAAMLSLRPSDINRRLGLKKVKPQGREDLLGTLNRLRAYLDRQLDLGKDLLTTLDNMLSDAPWNTLSRPELDMACETLKRAAQNQARSAAASAALKHWPGEPLFVLHRFEAKYPDEFIGRYTRRDIDDLERALDQAREQGDTRLAMRISEAFPFGSPFNSLPGDFFPDDDDDDDDDDDELPHPHPDAEWLSDLIDAQGVIKALKALDAPREVVKMIRDIRDRVGEQGARTFLKSLFTGTPPDLEMFQDSPLPLFDPEDQDPGSSRERRPKPRRRR